MKPLIRLITCSWQPWQTVFISHGLDSCWIYMGPRTSDQGSQKWLPPGSVCPGELQFPPASLGGSPRSAGGSDAGSFQITASAPDPGVCEILHAQPSGSPVCMSHWPSKPDILGACLPSEGPQAGELDVGLGPLTPWGEPLQSWLSWGCESWLYCVSALLPILLWFLLYVFCCRSFLLVFRSFSSIVAIFV